MDGVLFATGFDGEVLRTIGCALLLTGCLETILFFGVVTLDFTALVLEMVFLFVIEGILLTAFAMNCLNWGLLKSKSFLT